MPTGRVRKGMPSTRIDREAFRARFLSQFVDPAFERLRDELDRVAEAAWASYDDGRKSPRTRRAGPGFADPDYELATDWIAARATIEAAEARFRDMAQPPRVLVINASPRNEHTCPSEMSKSYRLAGIAREVLVGRGIEVEMLDLSRVNAEYGRHIHPCKACFSTASALCHWPCSCYPNYSLGQTQDWMNEIYPMWVAARGIMIVTPVHWYQATSPLKLMIDRLVCADGGNPDPTSTSGKDAEKAKALELDHWPYPRHLAGRKFALVVHGDSAGIEGLRRSLSDWLSDMALESAGSAAELDRYIGYYRPYATSHDDLDGDDAVQDEVRLAAWSLAASLETGYESGGSPQGALADPRPK